ncbi:PKD domain-containing protein [Clostridium sp. MSJ-8]|uniref:triple tyrosine motif-containing protein n=1 Tax=Clostridium sp. MSJ-8 TaxID=2841510 RepID=UPI001C0F26B9|nr:triple tyrosine motif-containing protein [Clostridium sp. MSJ-8]MBU5488563.1 PKD domain-containing protein [Clostridium sp. MSJ-8]
MKKSTKKLISLVTTAVVASGLFTSISGDVTANADTGLESILDNGYYATNPNGGVGKNKTITIDGSFSDWSEDMLIAQGVANDDPRAFRGCHEGPVYDSYALYAAWDNDNLYLMWQFVNVTDVVAPEQGYPISDNGKPWNGNMPIMLALDTGSGDYTDGTASDGKSVWGLNTNFTTNVDKVVCFSSKPGVGEPAIFSSVNGKLDYGTCLSFKDAGVQYKYGDGFLGSTLYGINNNGFKGYVPSDLANPSADWVNMLDKGHSTSQDTMYEMSIPLDALGISKDYLENNGIGVMQISTFGASGMNSVPMDPTFLDNATKAYSADDSTSGEKEDVDNVTVPLARVGKESGGEVTNPKISSLTANKTSVKVNESVKFTTAASGGTGSLSYKYEIDGNTVRDFSSASSYTWTPTKEGTYDVKVTVKDSNGKQATKNMSYVVEKEDEQVELTLDSYKTSLASPQEIGKSIVLSASATGNGTINYRFVAQKNGKTTFAQAFSTKKTATWTPTEAGTYTLYFKAKDSTGKTVSKTMKYTIKEPQVTLAIKSATTAVKSPQTVGTAIKMSTVAEGQGTLKYRFVAQKNGKTTFVKDYSTASSVTWTPTEAGTYKLTFKVKDSTGKSVYKVVNYVVEESQELKINSIKTNYASPQAAGKTIKITANASGAKNLQYRFWAYDRFGNWTVIQDFSSKNYVNWKAASEGNYIIWVDVKDSNDNCESSFISYVIK